MSVEEMKTDAAHAIELIDKATDAVSRGTDSLKRSVTVATGAVDGSGRGDRGEAIARVNSAVDQGESVLRYAKTAREAVQRWHDAV